MSQARRLFLSLITTFASLCLVGIASSLLAQTGARVLFSHGLPWTGELARLLAVWAALLGAAAGFENGELHRIDFLVRDLPRQIKTTVLLICWLAIAITLVLLIKAGIDMTSRALPQSSSAMEISMAWFYAAVPVAATLMALTHLADMFQMFSRDKS